MIDKDLLKSALLREHKNFGDLADALNINNTTLSEKLRTKRFTMQEIETICNLFNIKAEEIPTIFFAK